MRFFAYVKKSLFVLSTLSVFAAASFGSIQAMSNYDQKSDRQHHIKQHYFYQQRNLVTNYRNKYKTQLELGRKTFGDKNLINAWGLALRPAGAGGHFWVANTDTGTVSTYVGDTDSHALFQDDLKFVGTQSSPLTLDVPATPTGQVFNGSKEFPCKGKTFSGVEISVPAKFLIVTEDSNIQCWSETGSALNERMQSFTIAAKGDEGSIYKGLAITNFEESNYLYAINFSLERIEIYDGDYQVVVGEGFVKPGDIPNGFAPFNAEYFEYSVRGHQRQSLFVAYAQTTDEPGEEEQGPGLGYVAEFDIYGHYVRTLKHSRRLNAPWGFAIAADQFGRHSNRLLVGNFGDGTVVAFDLKSGKQKDYLRDQLGQAMQIDGLWDLAFGNGASLGRDNYLYFTAGPSSEADGLFGSLHWVL